jgi:hypothetical protein
MGRPVNDEGEVRRISKSVLNLKEKLTHCKINVLSWKRWILYFPDLPSFPGL